ncbi:hypothetical protein L9F63_023836, partial [Diploptera punctata]
MGHHIILVVIISVLLSAAPAIKVDRGGEFPNKDCPKWVCGLPEGSNCFNASLSAILPPESRKYGLCGANLHCLLRLDLASRDDPEALCYCKETEPACASNNRTYETVCQMNDEAIKMGIALYLKHWGPCNSVPWVTSGPVDVSGSLHQSLALDCEVKGYPIPGVYWEFRADNGDTRVLP